MSFRNVMPCVYASGTFYEVGYCVGSTFKSMIHEYIAEYKFLHEEIFPASKTLHGSIAYEETLKNLQTRFPHYLNELRGIADGAEVPFETILLMHMDGIVPKSCSGGSQSNGSGNGCSTIMCNQEDVILGHTEDAYPMALNRCYVVHATIREETSPGVFLEEKFSSLCYAGHLPGFCMSANSHGFIFTINVIQPRKLISGKTPRHFLTRALLAASNLEEAQIILRDRNIGSADGFCVNMAFLNQEGPVVFHSAEVGPAYDSSESQLSILTVSSGEDHAHCNKYLRLGVEEDPKSLTVESSTARHRVIDSHAGLRTCHDVVRILSDSTDPNFPIYRNDPDKHVIVTIATGIFDCRKKLWKLFIGRAVDSQPIAVFPLI